MRFQEILHCVPDNKPKPSDCQPLKSAEGLNNKATKEQSCPAWLLCSLVVKKFQKETAPEAPGTASDHAGTASAKREGLSF
jgi:hypothetical protein